MKEMQAIVLLILCFLFSTQLLSTELRIYKSKKYTDEVTITKTKTGYTIMSRSQIGVSEIIANKKMETISWRLTNEKDKCDVSAVLENGEIVVRGEYKGKKIDRRHKTNGRVWHQAFPIDMEYSVAENSTEMDIIMLIPIGSMIFQPVTMDVKQKRIVAVKVNSKEEEAILYQFSTLLFWKSSIWFRTSDGRYIKYQSGGDVFELLE